MVKLVSLLSNSVFDELESKWKKNSSNCSEERKKLIILFSEDDRWIYSPNSSEEKENIENKMLQLNENSRTAL